MKQEVKGVGEAGRAGVGEAGGIDVGEAEETWICEAGGEGCG